MRPLNWRSTVALPISMVAFTVLPAGTLKENENSFISSSVNFEGYVPSSPIFSLYFDDSFTSSGIPAFTSRLVNSILHVAIFHIAICSIFHIPYCISSGHVQRRKSEYIGRRMLDMELPGRRQRGRPKRRYMDVINEDMKLVGASVEDAEDRDRWREMIRCGDP
ncbi:hypothetical protein, partial [Plesiomonas sp.]|uniref:hypothetical protein n=1 Tax=Plesiomonas sp. TaxID=2486279 RepID=UPI003F3325B1